MNIEKLLKMQVELDGEIFRNAGLKEYPLEDAKLALLTEISELANEVQCFKYWKKNKEINREKVLEEFADCLHFALSLENKLKQFDREKLQYAINNINENLKKLKNLENDLRCAFIQTFDSVINENHILSSVISLGLCIGISLEKMEQAYLDKNKVNHDRQAAGY